ncbi:MAG: hypothetical protein Q8O06_00670 [Acetobacterium sp.]|nr:hypothetical protein [Acetobacterium sp.]
MLNTFAIEQLKSNLSGFTGTENYHAFSALFRKVVLTDGAHYLAQTAGAFWLMDIIGSVYTAHPEKKKFWDNGFAVWTLKVEDKKGVVTADDGNNNIFYSQEIEFTDFPLSEMKLFVELGETINEGEVMVVMLPSER